MKTSRANAGALGGRHGLSRFVQSRLASTAEGRVIALAGFVQGVVLVTFPVVSALLAGMRTYGLSGTQYGDMILPEAVAAIIASLTGFGLARRETTRRIYRLGLNLSLTSMVLLVASAFVQDKMAVGYPLMLSASAIAGAGFGLTVPVLTAYARFVNATAEDSSVVALHALLGLGALVAPGLAALFRDLGFWWGFPALSAALLIILLRLSDRMPSRVGAPRVAPVQVRRRIVRFSLYTICIMVYAVCAAVVVIWSQLGLANRPRLIGVAPAAPTIQLVSAVSLANPVPGIRASLVFAIFWGGLLTVGRVLFAAADRWQSPLGRAACYFGPILVLSAIIAAGVLSHERTVATIGIFGLAGLGCAALMPLKFIAGQKDVTVISAAVAGGVVAYQLGFGIVAAGLRPQPHAPLGAVLFFATAVLVGIFMVATSSAMVRPGVLDRPVADAPPDNRHVIRLPALAGRIRRS